MNKSDGIHYSKHHFKKQYIAINAIIHPTKWLLEIGKMPLIMHILNNACDLFTDVILNISFENKDVIVKTLCERKEFTKVDDQQIKYKNIIINTCIQSHHNQSNVEKFSEFLNKNSTGSKDSIIMINAITPLFTKQMMQYMFHAVSLTPLTKAVVLGKNIKNKINNSNSNRRIVLDQTYGTFIKIIDQKDCSDCEKESFLVDTGIYAFKTKAFLEYLKYNYIESSFDKSNPINFLKHVKYSTEYFSSDTIEVITSHITEFDETLNIQDNFVLNILEQSKLLQTEYYKKFVVESIDNSAINMSSVNLVRLVRILDQLSSVKSQPNEIDEPKIDKIRNHIYSISKTSTNKKFLMIIKYEETIIGTGSILIEDKIIHDMGLVGHIEDIAIDENYRGLGLARTLMHKLIDIARLHKCYKIILDASDDVKIFYEKMGFKKNANTMRMNL